MTHLFTDYQLILLLDVIFVWSVILFFMKAYKLGMYGKNYVWMIPGYYSAGWQTNVDDVNCSAEELKIATEGYLTATFSMYGISKDVGRCGRVRSALKSQLCRLCSFQPLNTDFTQNFITNEELSSRDIHSTRDTY